MLLEVKELNTYYGMSHVLQGISLTIDEGEVVALLGRNGMGKSTTLKSVMGMVKPSSGQIIYKGDDITGNPPFRVARLGIGYVPEDRRIFPNLTVDDNLTMGIKHGRAAKAGNSNAWSLDRVYDHFPKLKERCNQKGSLLSGGEQQMLAIGRALMGRPELLLLDEPSMGIAPLVVREIYNVVKQLNQAGTTVLLVEQNARAALKVAHHSYVLERGEIVLEGLAAELLDNPKVKEHYLGG